MQLSIIKKNNWNTSRFQSGQRGEGGRLAGRQASHLVAAIIQVGLQPSRRCQATGVSPLSRYIDRALTLPLPPDSSNHSPPTESTVPYVGCILLHRRHLWFIVSFSAADIVATGTLSSDFLEWSTGLDIQLHIYYWYYKK